MKPKSVTIKLTDKQRSKLRNLTGEEHTEVRFENYNTTNEPLAERTALSRRSALAKKSPMASKKALAKKAPMASKKALARKAPMASKKALAKKAPMASKKALAKKLAGRKALVSKF